MVAMVITHHIAHCCDTTEKEFAASKEINLFIGQNELKNTWQLNSK